MRAAALAVLLVVSAETAAAAGPILWAAPPECGDQAELSRRIGEHLGRPLGDTDAIEAAVEVVRDAETGEYRAEIQLGEVARQVKAPDCAAVTEAVAFVIALAVQESEPEQEPAPERQPEPAPPVEPAPRIVTVAPRRNPLDLRMRLDGEVAAGTLPGAGLGGGAAIAIGRAPFSIELGFAAYAPARAPAPGADMAGADIDLISGRARLCGARGGWRICGGGAVGRMGGRGVGVEDPRSAVRRWSAVTVGGGWSRPLAGPLAIAVELDVGVAVERPRFTLDDGTLLHEPAPVGARLAVGIEARFP